jgi:hypothetical protein
MKTLFFKLSLCVLVGGLIGCVSVPVVSKTEVALNGVTIGQEKQAIIKLLGEPIYRITLEGYHDLLFKYKNIDIYFYDDKIDEIYTDDPSVCTPLNVCPGNSLARLREIYGWSPLRNKNDQFIATYLLAGSDCWLDFLISEGRVSSINAKCPV